MNIVLGIDVGGSTTKIVGYQEQGDWIGAQQVVAADQITSLYGSIGNFTHLHNIPIKAISKIIVTGVGASLITESIYDIPTYKADEFYSVGVGGLALSGKEEALVVSMGTGTAYVRATKDSITHIGGSGVGGGTLLGLSERLFNETDFAAVNLTAQTGNLANVDLSVEDICKDNISNFPSHTTASNFGKIKNTATTGDLAFGLVNMVFQTIGMLAVFACRNDHIKTVVLTGTLTTLTQAREIFDFLRLLHGIDFIIPENAVYATAIGAAIPYIKKIP
jgi:type II pantothenate kinase